MKIESLDLPRVHHLSKALRLGIQRGEWAVGSTLPTTRELARQHSVGLATVQSVLQELEAHGLVERRPRQGTVVKSRTPRLAKSDQRQQQVAIVGRAKLSSEEQDAGLVNGWGFRIARSLEAALGQQELQPVPVTYDHQSESCADDVLARIEAMGTNLIGVVIFNTPAMHPLPAMLDQVGMPWVTINRMVPDQSHNYVAADNLAGCRVVGECLARMGRLKTLVLMVNGVNVSETESEKITGLIQGFLHAEAPINGIDYVKCEHEGRAYELTQQYIREHGKPDAIFSLTDEMASGAMAACVDMGIRLPDDISVVGGAGLELARHTRPRLTVISQPMEAIGREACEMIQAMIARDVRRIEPKRICGQFIVRDSLPVSDVVMSKLEQRFPEMIVSD